MMRRSLLTVLAASASGHNFPDAETLQEMVDMFKDSLEAGNGAQLFGHDERRLSEKKGEGSVPHLDYGKVCNSTCWSSLSTSFSKALTTLDGNECKKKKQKEKADKVKKVKDDIKKKKDGKGKSPPGAAGEGGGRLLQGQPNKPGQGKKPGEEGKPGGPGGKGDKPKGGKKQHIKESHDCIFSMCKSDQMKAMCGNITALDDYDIDSCHKANAVFLCESVCSDHCKDDSHMKHLLCGKHHKSKGGKFDSDKGGGDLKKMFNTMCTQNAAGDYCYDLVRKQAHHKKYHQGKHEKKFPKACDLNCTSTLASAITELGCCFPVLMSVQGKYDIMHRGQARNAKAVALKCAPDAAFTKCAKGALTEYKNQQFKLDLSTACDAISDETKEDALVATMTDMLNLTEGALEMLDCKKKGEKCGTTGATSGAGGRLRRLQEQVATSEATVNIETSGADSDAQMAAIQAKLQDKDFLADLTATSEENAGVEVVTSAPDAGQTGIVGAAHGNRVISCAAVLFVASMFML